MESVGEKWEAGEARESEEEEKSVELEEFKGEGGAGKGCESEGEVKRGLRRDRRLEIQKEEGEEILWDDKIENKPLKDMWVNYFKMLL